MKPKCLKTALLVGLLSLNGRAASWSEKVIAALGRNEISEARNLIIVHEPGCGFVGDYSELESKLVQHRGLAASAAGLRKDLQRALNRNFSNECFQRYLAIAEDTNQAASARLSVVQVMVDRDHKLHGANKKGLANSLIGLLNRASTPSEIKSHILQKIGRYPVSEDGGVFLGYFNSEDSLVRGSALRSLAGRIRANRKSEKHSVNRSIFDAVIGLDSSCVRFDQVKVVAAINENYARDYLLARCAGDANRIAAIFHMDDSLSHMGILREALRLYSANPSDSTLKNAIQYGTKKPESIAPVLMSGNTVDREAGALLSALFPVVSGKRDEIGGSRPTNGNEGGN